MLERYNRLDRQLKGEKETEKDVNKKVEDKQQKEFSILPSYANDFLEKRKKEERAKQKYYELLAESQEIAKNDKTLIECSKKMDNIYEKMRELKYYGPEFQELVSEKNRILDEVQAHKDKVFSNVYDAQKEYQDLSTTADKKTIIQNMADDMKMQLKKISSNNDKLVKEIENLDIKTIEALKENDKNLDAKQDEISKAMRALDFYSPERAKLRKEFGEIATERGNIKKQIKEEQYNVALKVNKLLKINNGIELNTKNSSAMNNVVTKMKNCLDGVIPEHNYSNPEVSIKKYNKRAYHSGSTLHISENCDIGTSIHEMMHNLEEHSEHILMNSLAFATSRTNGEKQQSLKKITNLSYKANEVCKKDNFFNPYCGKLYDVFGGKNKTFISASASEIMSMGVQELFTNPKEFIKKDREYFDFVVANLQCKLWN